MESNKREKNFEKYKIVEVDRKDLKNAPYNPRVITETAKKKLRKNIKKVGLLEPPVWNALSGNLVSGHQRVSILDGLMGTRDYKIRVSRVELDDKTEKEQNIFFNNTAAMGDYDLEKLEELLKQDLEIEDTGFDVADMYKLFGDNVLIEDPDKLLELSEQISKNESLYKELQGRARKRDDVDFFCVVVFRDNQQREGFLSALGLPDNRYQDGRTLQDLIKK